ncbi:LysE family translocator [Sphaerisporangium sp. TRM90804]|uniref:LysE family translocator n=1 Tax=Sphaerisporangium sp. TRM90804 TaxID=3031113 RepID=UPI00244A9A74|nr:LysE family translocator [Sphaerisporangium sp. TRM90804]MDH2424039.1 LysE family translocator [Sphaerisporangium sp. TRM90804]
MVSLTQVVVFAGLVQVAAMSPGPDFAVVVRRSAVGGRGNGMAAALGVTLGVVLWVVAAAVGVAALLAASAVAFTVVKVVGAAYLLFLGVKALRSSARATEASAVTVEHGGDTTMWAAFREGLLCNVLNPKAALFFVALIPHFLSGQAGAGDITLLAAVAAALTITWFSIVATLVSAFRRFFARPRVRRAVDAVTGTALVALGVRLATAGDA